MSQASDGADGANSGGGNRRATTASFVTAAMDGSDSRLYRPSPMQTYTQRQSPLIVYTQQQTSHQHHYLIRRTTTPSSAAIVPTITPTVRMLPSGDGGVCRRITAAGSMPSPPPPPTTRRKQQFPPSETTMVTSASLPPSQYHQTQPQVQPQQLCRQPQQPQQSPQQQVLLPFSAAAAVDAAAASGSGSGAAALAPEEDEVEQIQVDTYIEYHPPKLRSGLAHPDEVVETVSLSSVNAPEIRYTMSIPDEVVDEGRISALQLEAALYACQAHERRLPSGERFGYLIGDGAGVGKGRTIATIIYENYRLGRRRAIWLSTSSDLKLDAERDLRDIGAASIRVYALNKLKYARINGAENGFIKRGVIFSTYSSLICESRGGGGGTGANAEDAPESYDNVRKSGGSSGAYSSRLKQLVQWCGTDFDGVLVFDECHRAKNLCPVAGKPTKTGRFVMELQRALPSARVVYASATGATEPRNMAYMTRLGLWGPAQTFETFNDFIHAVENRGVGAMEMVAMDMKLRGLYMARQLSFRGASFYVEEVELTREFVTMYDESVRLWMELRRQFAKVLAHMPARSTSYRKVWSHFWSAHQRFFKYLCISSKVLHHS